MSNVTSPRSGHAAALLSGTGDSIPTGFWFEIRAKEVTLPPAVCLLCLCQIMARLLSWGCSYSSHTQVLPQSGGGVLGATSCHLKFYSRKSRFRRFDEPPGTSQLTGVHVWLVTWLCLSLTLTGCCEILPVACPGSLFSLFLVGK